MDPVKEEEKKEVFIPPMINVEMDQTGNLSIKSNMSNKMMIKHILEMAIEIVIKDITQKSSILYMPDNNGMPIRRS